MRGAARTGGGRPRHCQCRDITARVGADSRGGGVITTLRNTRAIACALAWTLVLVLFAGPAFALGLGRIEVKSQRDEPLLAEIEIISSDAAELDQLQARLASPDTFARIGLEPPQGIVSNLQFTVALDARGRPVIRVTSDAPVQQSLLTFLVEVDWGQGRLVREYSALLDAPQTVSAPAQPPIQAPVAAPGNTIVRQAETPAAPAPEPSAEATPEADAVAATAAPAPEPEPAPPDARVAPSPSPTAAAPPAADEYGPVQAGDTLGGIAAGMRAEGETLDQAMVALFRANPEAFIAGNLNLMRQGVVLRMPQGPERTQYSAAEATAVVREQIGQWREMRRPAPQPEAVAAAPADAGAADPGAAQAPRVAGARLEIVPPGEGGGQQAGTRSGIDAGGEGDMLRQELQQKDEALAARAAEVEELKARVADLEKLQAQQQQLISLKDSELAAAQQRLADSNARPAATVADAAPGNTATASPSGDTGSVLAWVGLALVLAAMLAWWLLRRRAARPAPRVFDTAALAAGMPASPTVPPAAPGPAPTPLVPPAPAAAPSWNVPAAGAVVAAPPWHADDEAPVAAPVPAAASAPPVPPVDAPAAPPVTPVASGPAVAAVDAQRDDGRAAVADSGRERIELARAYVDLGDIETARGLLEEVAGGGDRALRDEASRLLRELA